MTTSSASARVVDLSDSDVPAAPLPWRRVGLVLAWVGGWSAVVVAMAALVSAQKAVPLRYTLPSEAVNYYTLAVESLIVWRLCQALAARRWHWTATAAIHVVSGIALVAIWQTIYGMYLRGAIGPRVYDEVFRGAWMFQMMNACVIYGGVVVGTIAIQAARRAREHERVQHELTLLARDAELRALALQLEPHFLLNTLTSIMALVDANPRDARTMLERLSDLLRAAFDEIQETEVSLERELELIAAYLGIEQVRFGERLRVVLDVPPSLRSIGVPPFLLQPIVENAVKHAVAPFSVPGTITIRAWRDGTRLSIEVSDTGPGFADDLSSSRGHGLRLAERRLTAFAPDGTVTVASQRTGSTITIAFTA